MINLSSSNSGGLILKIITHKPWIIDFRDPWTLTVGFVNYEKSKILINFENWLELQDLGDSDDLVKASINQKDRMLVSYDFLKAVRWSSLRPFLAFLLVPMLLLAFLLSEQGRNVIFQGGERLVNYSVVYEKTLPFLLELEQELKIDEGQDLTLYINTVGNVKPEALYITSVKGKQELEQISPTKFRKVFISDLIFCNH